MKEREKITLIVKGVCARDIIREAENIALFVKAVNTLERKMVLDASIPKGVVEVHINPEDKASLNKTKCVTNRMEFQNSFLMGSFIHTYFLGKEATDRVLSEASSDSFIRRWFYLKKVNYDARILMASDMITHLRREIEKTE